MSGKNMAAKCKIFVTLTLHFIGISSVQKVHRYTIKNYWHEWEK